ncbi:MAG: RNB domain-containing ribonuclease [Bacilli bacterium]
MKFKEKDINNILNSNSVDELKKALKIKDEDYFKNFISYLERIIYNYSENLEEVTYKIIEMIESDVLNTKDYLDKCNKIITFRTKFSNIYQTLYKKTRKNNDISNKMKDIMIYLEKIRKNFDDEVKVTSTNTKDNSLEFEEYLNFLEYILKNFDENNMDLVDKILNHLEINSNKSIKDVLRKYDQINNIKKILEKILDKKQENYQEEKDSINNYNYILKKIERIESNLSDKIETDLSDDNVNVFEYLLERLNRLIISFSDRNIDAIYKILGLLEKEVLKDNDLNYLKEAEKILELRKSIVDTIKSTKKNTRKSHRKYYYLKEIANKLENLEINIAYNIKSEEVLANYNIIKHIIFDLENIKYTENLIKNNPYLINAFNLNSKNIISLVVDKYLESVNSNKRSYEKICYYDKTLDLLLTSKFIKTEEFIIKENISKITKMYKDKLISGKSNEFISSWYKNLIDKINNPDYIKEEKYLNKMYNIIVPKEEKLEKINFNKEGKNKDFIVTIDESVNVNKDDAFSVKKIEDDLYNLKVYIADPNSLFSSSSVSMKNARNNTQTIYLEDKKIDMFHPEVVNNYLSLDENKLRNVKVYDFILDKKGNLVSFDIKRESMRVNKNYSYDEFNNLLDICFSHNQEEFIENLMIIKDILSNKGLEDLAEKELGIEITNAEKLVASFMIYTNNKVAEFFAKNGYPFIYRHYTYDKPFIDRSILEVVPNEKKEKYAHFLEEIGKTSNNAIYSVDSMNHDALGLGYYTHITSPNRRYADIIANSCVDNFYFNSLTDKEILEFENYLKNEVNYLNDRIEGLNNYYDGYARYVLTRK